MTISDEQIWATPVRGEESRRPARRPVPEVSPRHQERLWRCVKWILFLLVFFSVWLGWASIAHS